MAAPRLVADAANNGGIKRRLERIVAIIVN
jgi:hypothetical protein